MTINDRVKQVQAVLLMVMAEEEAEEEVEVAVAVGEEGVTDTMTEGHLYGETLSTKVATKQREFLIKVGEPEELPRINIDLIHSLQDGVMRKHHFIGPQEATRMTGSLTMTIGEHIAKIAATQVQDDEIRKIPVGHQDQDESTDREAAVSVEVEVEVEASPLASAQEEIAQEATQEVRLLHHDVDVIALALTRGVLHLVAGQERDKVDQEAIHQCLEDL